MSAARAATVVLVGMRGAGKSTVGARLAELEGLAFVDLDQRTLECGRRAGYPAASVGELLTTAGEPAFREAEAQALRALLEPQVRCVVAAGGGVVERFDNRVWLRRAAWVVWLEASVETLRRRIAAAPGTRPALRGADPLAEVEELARRRSPLYAEVADLRLASDEADPDELARRIAQALRD